MSHHQSDLQSGGSLSAKTPNQLDLEYEHLHMLRLGDCRYSYR